MSGASATVTVRDLVRHLDETFPFSSADAWDRVGLLAGDPGAAVKKVLVTLDPTPDAIARADAQGSNVLVTHHPAFLDPPAALTPQSSRAAFEAISRGVALVACHTNLDRAPAACDALPSLLGLTPSAPLERGRQPVALVTVYVPVAAADDVIGAMSAAGAGRIGEYRGCAFSAPGEGTFVPGATARPVAGRPGERSSAEELRVEMVCDPGSAAAVTSAARGAHPYEQPLIVVADADIDRGVARLGRVSDLPQPATLRDVAERVADALAVVPRVWGDPDAPVVTVGTVSGGGGSLVPDALAAGVSVLVTGEVRYHTALEALEGGLAIVEAGHDVTEWPHVPVLARALRSLPGLAERVAAEEPAQRWWTP